MIVVFQYSDEVLACFESFKLDEVKSSKRKLEVLKKAQTSQSFFAKYLTSEKVCMYTGIQSWCTRNFIGILRMQSNRICIRYTADVVNVLVTVVGPAAQ